MGAVQNTALLLLFLSACSQEGARARISQSDLLGTSWSNGKLRGTIAFFFDSYSDAPPAERSGRWYYDDRADDERPVSYDFTYSIDESTQVARINNGAGVIALNDDGSLHVRWRAQTNNGEMDLDETLQPIP
jgi:hypothetical protein